MNYTYAVAVVGFLLSAATALAQVPSTPSDNPAPGEEGKVLLFRHASLDHAWGATQQSRRPIFVYVTSDHCYFCQKMASETWSHPQIAAGVAGYTEPVMVDASRAPEVAKKLGVRAFPTTLIISHEGKLLHRIEGFAAPRAFAEQVWPVLRLAESERQTALAEAAARLPVAPVSVSVPVSTSAR
jgi:thioredoxin-like negative regulator of GroEL